MRPKIFVVGDSRTGTMSLHKFFLALGIKSVHYFVKESGQKSPDHENRDANQSAILEFVKHSGYQAFSDYPTRLYYKELAQEYPDACFILTTRKDVETWKKSMRGFFAKFNIGLDIDRLSRHYIELNQDIREFMGETGARFLEVCIDDGLEVNSEKIKDFVGIDSPVQIGWENRTESYDNSVISKRAQLFSPPSGSMFQYINSRLGNSKAMPSEHGWIYLANDTNSFLEYQFGELAWDTSDVEKAAEVLSARYSVLSKRGIRYLKFVVPEKSVVYPEFLPRCFSEVEMAEARPANQLASAGLDFFHYLGPYLRDAKSRGFLYFMGDTHTNWLGAYFVYLRIVEVLRETMGTRIPKPIPLSSLEVSAVKYKGDLGVQLTDELQSEILSTWSTIQPANGENLLRFVMSKKAAEADDAPPDELYTSKFSERPHFIRERQDSSLPRAVIFRDSTLDFCIDLLSEHFSRSVFIWHKGQVYEDVIERERPDVVIHVMAERFVSMYPKFPSLAKGLD